MLKSIAVFTKLDMLTLKVMKMQDTQSSKGNLEKAK